MRRWVLPVVAVALVLAVALVDGTQAAGRSVAPRPGDRVLIVSLPGVGWADVEAHDLPNLEALAAEAAVGQLATRVGRRGASLTDAYLSLGAGTRALAPSLDPAVALDPEESYGGIRTTDILLRRIGRVPDGIAYLAAGAARQRNLDGPFGGEPGRLGEALEEAGVGRAVIANADAAEGFPSDEPPPEGAYGRAAATVLMGREGIVPGGAVGRGLLVDDPAAPFGRRLDPEAVQRAFDAVWGEQDRQVVLVEASDLARASAYGPRATASQRRRLRADALVAADRLLGDLVRQVDPSTTAVLVLSPVAPGGGPDLALVALRAPAVSGGVLRSATTRRDGYVQLADVAPTVLHLLGEEEPDEIEGRTFEVTSRSGGRIGELVDEAEAARFRDALMPVVVPAVIAVLALLAALWRWRARLPAAASAAVAPLAHACLGVVPATFLVAQVPAVVGKTGAYLAAVAAVAAVVGAATWALDRRRPGFGPIGALAVVVGLFVVDVLVGAPLQVNAVFGYSVSVAGRFAGIGNLAFALFAAATVLLAALAADRWGSRALPGITALLAVVVLVEGLPMLGADVGGVVSTVPAFALVLLVLRGVRLRPIHGLGAAALAGVAVLVFAVVDALRPPGERTHLSRLADHVGAGRLGSFASTITRRLQASFGDAEAAVWLLVLGLVAVVAAYVVLVGRGHLGPGERSHRRPVWLQGPASTAALTGLVVLALVGLVANDSSIAVPATMLIVVAPIAVLRAQAAAP